MFNLQSNFNEWYAVAVERGKDEAEKVPCDESEAWVVANTDSNTTMLQFLRKMLIDKSFETMWALWCFKATGDQLDKECRLYFLRKLREMPKRIRPIVFRAFKQHLNADEKPLVEQEVKRG